MQFNHSTPTYDTDQDYQLKTKIKVFKKSYSDHKKTLCTDTLVALIPQDCLHINHFYEAWVPLADEVSYEFEMEISTPINDYCRGYVIKGTKEIPERHLVVMSRAIEQKMIDHHMDDKIIWVTVLSENKEGVADFL